MGSLKISLHATKLSSQTDKVSVVIFLISHRNISEEHYRSDTDNSNTANSLNSIIKFWNKMFPIDTMLKYMVRLKDG